VRRDEVCDALLAVLRAQVDGNGDPLRIGDGKAPEPPDGEEIPKTPYAVLRPIPGGSKGGGMKNPHRRMSLLFEVRSVGWDRWSTQRIADALEEAITGRDATGYLNDITGTGWTVGARSHVVLGGVSREGLLFNQFDEYGLLVLPAA
jgi:hypothetical protein